MSKHILLADDSITIQKVVELTFSPDAGYRVTSVGGGAQALAKVREARPDLILCDVIMPEKNGYEVTETLKSNPATRGIPIILLSGTFEPFDEDRARRAGADAWITKPFESQQLIALVEEHLAKRVSLSDAEGDPGATLVASSPSSGGGLGKAPNPDQAVNFTPAQTAAVAPAFTPAPAPIPAATPISAVTAAMAPISAPAPAPSNATAVTAAMAPITPVATSLEERRQAVTQNMVSGGDLPPPPPPPPEPAPRCAPPRLGRHCPPWPRNPSRNSAPGPCR